MDGIQTYPGQPGPSPYHPGPAYQQPHQAHPHAHVHLHGGVVKTPSDYLRAIRRQIWLVLTVATFVSVLGAVVVLKMKAVYRTDAEITIRPPEYDGVLSQLVSTEHITRQDKDANDTYVPDRLAYLRSRGLIERVVRDPGVSGPKGPPSLEDAILEVTENLTTRNYTGTSFFKVSLEGTDAAKTTRTLRVLLDKFRQQAEDESLDVINQSILHAQRSLRTFSDDLKKLDEQIYDLRRSALTIAIGGKSILQERYDQTAATIMQKKILYEDLQRKLQMEAMHPREGHHSGGGREGQLAELAEKDRMLRNRLAHIRRTVKPGYFNDDPTVQHIRTQIEQIREMRARVENEPEEAAPPDQSEMILASARAEIDKYENESVELLGKLQESIPDYNRWVTLTKERELKAKQISDITQNLSSFQILAKTQKAPVTITVPAIEPTLPVRPKRSISIALCIFLGLSMGIGLACLREYLDQSVKVPEHLTAGLTMPLLGVIPRMRRTSRNTRGGHLWTPGVPESIAADAYRNLRASLVGVAHAKGQFVTLLVTSAKAGEGKSTTALNLAATCARAGERTLLVDIDLRRPSLADVFPHDQGHLGLVDVLRGEMPWQQTVVPSDLPNLDFLPTGDTRDVPIEILGSLELRQLLKSLASNHYDRVILDGPAVLGLADCRMLGRIVDAAIMVVRSGSVELRPLKRAKAVLDQSQVHLAGLVFNGLSEDLDNWSSYGPGPGSSDAGLDGPRTPPAPIESARVGAGASATV